jgi:hypothetical protein
VTLPRIEPTDVDGLRFRAASRADASRISAFYAACYASNDGRAATDNYPFPQVLQPDWVDAMLATKMIRWVLAETTEERTVGAAGILKGVGSRADGIAECFGLVVDSEYRGCGLGRGVLDRVREITLREATVALGQMRTVDPAAAQVVERATFVPIGFEPFVHRMLAGDESMVAVAMLPAAALARRICQGQTTPAVRALAQTVLEPLLVAPLASVPGTSPSPRRFGEHLRLMEVYEELGTDLLQQLPTSEPRTPRFVDLRRMDELGREEARRKQRYFAALAGDDVVGCIQAAHNRHDRHFRIEAMASTPREAQPEMLRRLIELVDLESNGEPHVIVADLVATRIAQQRALEAVGFVPTSYCPALIAVGRRRLDVVQYTRLFGYTVSSSIGFLDGMRWATAKRLVRHVTTALATAASPSGR